VLFHKGKGSARRMAMSTEQRTKSGRQKPEGIKHRAVEPKARLFMKLAFRSLIFALILRTRQSPEGSAASLDEPACVSPGKVEIIGS